MTSAELLLTLSFLDHSLIWEEILHMACKRLSRLRDDEGQEGIPDYLVKLFSDDSYAFDLAMEPLLTFSMVRRKQGKITIHPLVGQCARKWAPSSERREKEAIRLISAAFKYSSSLEHSTVPASNIVTQIQHSCSLAKRLDRSCDAIVLPFVDMCNEACWVGGINSRQTFLESAEPFLDREKQPLLALRHAEMRTNLYTDTQNHQKAVVLLQDTLKWAKNASSITPLVNAQVGTLTIQLSGIMAVSGLVAKSHEIMQSWQPLDPDQPAADELRVLGYRDRLWGRHLYLERRYEEAERILRKVFNREPIGLQNRAWVVTHLADVLVALSKPEEIVPLIEDELAAMAELIENDSAPVTYHEARLKVNLCEALIELDRYAEAETILLGLLARLEMPVHLLEKWAFRESFFAESGLARISHSQKQWSLAVERWQAVLRWANKVGWSRDMRCAKLASLSLEDAEFELGAKRRPAQTVDELDMALQIFDIKSKGPMLVEEPMFLHWEAVLKGKLRKRVTSSSSAASETTLVASLSQTLDTLSDS